MTSIKHPDNARDKALALNLDSNRYGTFAEIGAGQEVVRWFFRVGGAAGTVAKSMSAYDMVVSDAIYGPGVRYVSRERLQSMLDREHGLNLERLQDTRKQETAYFAFADTVAARSYRGTDECHAWMGVKFQAEPRDADSQIIIHVRMLDEHNEQQQEALGIVGVNLVYGATKLYDDPAGLLKSLVDGLDPKCVEIDMVSFSGAAFQYVDNRVMSLRLVEFGLTGAAMFSPSGEVLQASEMFYKKHVLVERGRFRPITLVNLDILDCAKRNFFEEKGVDPGDVVVIAELTMSNLLSEGKLDLQDFLDRVDIISATGHTVLITDSFEYYGLCSYLARYTDGMIGLALGMENFLQLFDERFYDNLDGGILEAFGRLFKNRVKLYVYPKWDPVKAELVRLDTFDAPEQIRPLFEYLQGREYFEQVEGYRHDILHIFSQNVLTKIREDRSDWEEDVPPKVAELIKARGLFGWSPEEG